MIIAAIFLLVLPISAVIGSSSIPSKIGHIYFNEKTPENFGTCIFVASALIFTSRTPEKINIPLDSITVKPAIRYELTFKKGQFISRVHGYVIFVKLIRGSYLDLLTAISVINNKNDIQMAGNRIHVFVGKKGDFGNARYAIAMVALLNRCPPRQQSTAEICYFALVNDYRVENLLGGALVNWDKILLGVITGVAENIHYSYVWVTMYYNLTEEHRQFLELATSATTPRKRVNLPQSRFYPNFVEPYQPFAIVGEPAESNQFVQLVDSGDTVRPVVPVQPVVLDEPVVRTEDVQSIDSITDIVNTEPVEPVKSRQDIQSVKTTDTVTIDKSSKDVPSLEPDDTIKFPESNHWFNFFNKYCCIN